MKDSIKIKLNKDSSSAIVETEISNIVGGCSIAIDNVIEICKRQSCEVGIQELESVGADEFIEIIRGNTVSCFDRLYKKIQIISDVGRPRRRHYLTININRLDGIIEAENTSMLADVIEECTVAHRESLELGLNGDMQFAVDLQDKKIEFYIGLEENSKKELVRRLGEKYDVRITRDSKMSEIVTCSGYIRMK